MIASTLLVLVGVAAETYLELPFSSKLAPKWRELFSKLAAGVLIIGIAGELLGETKTISFGDQISGFLNDKAGRADVKAGEANRLAGVAYADAGKANKEAARLSVEAENAKVQLAIAQKNALLAQAEAAKIEKAAAWRRLSVVSFSNLANSLRGPNHTVTIAYTENDPEALTYADAIAGAFVAAPGILNGTKSWKITPDPRFYTDRVLYGVSIPGPENEAVKAIRQAFILAKIPFDMKDVPLPVTRIGGMISTSGPVTTDALIMVGSRQPPP